MKQPLPEPPDPDRSPIRDFEVLPSLSAPIDEGPFFPKAPLSRPARLARILAAVVAGAVLVALALGRRIGG